MPGSPWYVHAVGTCEAEADLSGYVYAVTRFGPLGDLIKVGQTRDRVDGSQSLRISTYMKTRDAERRMWIARADDRKVCEVEVIRRLASYRPEDRISQKAFYRLTGHCAGRRSRPERPQDLLNRLLPGTGTFRTPVEAVLPVMRAVTGNDPVEVFWRNGKITQGER